MRSLKGWVPRPTDTGATGARCSPLAARRHRASTIAGVAITAILVTTLGAVAPAFAATPPVPPNDITIFPDRDFVSLAGYETRAGQTATISVTRGGILSGRAQGTIGTGDPSLEVNHPGGVPWGTGTGAPNVTPNIKAGDVVTVAFSGGGSDSATTQSPTVTSSTLTGSTVVVNGTLNAPGGPVPNTANLEQRIIEPALVNTDVARRDVRAGATAPGVTSSTITFDPVINPTTFTATYNFATASTAAIAAEGGMRVLTWMATDALANRQGMTISEFGEVGGPGMPGGPPGPQNTAPNAPANVSGVRGNFSLTASWNAATTIVDGSPVTGYVLEVQPVAGGLIDRQNLGANVVSHAVGGLTNETPYNISVRAVSAAGQGPEGTGGPVTPSAAVATAPGPPTAVGATAGNASATVRWTPPADDGGSPNTYLVRVVDAAGAQVGALRPAAAGATSLNVTGLVNGTAVRFEVQATSSLGTSPPSALSTAVTPATVPGAPTGVSAVAGIAQATLSWTAPVSNGGMPVTGYTVTASPGGRTATTTGATTATVTGLANGTAHTFTATAMNVAGTGAVSVASNAVTPTAPATTPITPVTPVTPVSPVQRYVTRVYSDLFSRAPDSKGLTDWTGKLNSGTPRVAVANAITSSTEYRSKLIAGSYDRYLSRTPDPTGLRTWLGTMNAGRTISQMESGFIASNEYFGKSGSTNAGWVKKLYSDVLGRAASPAEVSRWTAQLDRRLVSRTKVAMGFLLSPEHLGTVVDGHYKKLLGRSLDPTGRKSWVKILGAGGRDEAIIGNIIASAEYFGKS